MTLRSQFIERFGMEFFGGSTGPHIIPTSLRFELGIGDDPLSYLITAFHRFNTVLEDLGFKDQPVGVAAYIYAYSPTDEEQAEPLHKQFLPFARMIPSWNLGKFQKSELLLTPPDEGVFCACHFSLTTLNDFCVSRSILEHLLRDFGGSNDTPLLMFFNLDIGIMINPYDDRGMDVFGPNRDLLAMLYHKRNDWLLDYDRERMDTVYKTT